MNMSTPHEALVAFDKQSDAERFVDDVTLLRMLRVRIPQADPKLYGADGTAISDRHAAGRKEDWDTQTTDIAMRFPDGSLAYRMRETQRWEVWRSW